MGSCSCFSFFHSIWCCYVCCASMCAHVNVLEAFEAWLRCCKSPPVLLLGHHGGGRTSGVLVWESEASYPCIQMALMQVGEVSLFEFSLCYIWMINEFRDVLQVSVRAFSFGLFHQRWVRPLLSLVPRFNGRHDVQLSSVRLTENLQLGYLQPQMQKPIRSMGEPPVRGPAVTTCRPSSCPAT